MPEHVGCHASGLSADRDDSGLPNRTLVMDGAGNVVEVDGAPAPLVTLAELVPGLDAAAFAHCRDWLHSGSASALQIDVPVPGKPA